MKKESYFQLTTIVKTFQLIEILVTDRALSLADLCRRSNLSEEQRMKLYEKHPLISFTSKTIKSKNELEDELRVVRDRGYAVDDEEGVAGVRCVGAPVFNRNNHVIAGLSIAGPTVRISKKDIARLSKLVTRCASMISEGLGSNTFSKSN